MTDNSEDIELKKVVKRSDGKWDVVHCTKEGKIGEAINKTPFDTKEKAEAMHRAIQASKNAGKSGAFNTGVEVKSDSEGNLIVEGHFTTGDKDLVGDVMTNECLNDVVLQAVGKGVDIEHAQYLNNPGNEDREPFTVLKAERTLKPDGVKIEVLIRKSYDKFNEIKDKLIKGEIKAFSFAFTVTDAITKGGKRLLNKIDLKNITLTRNPINPAATITSILLKSLDDFKMVENNSTGATPEGIDKKIQEVSKEMDELYSLKQAFNDIKRVWLEGKVIDKDYTYPALVKWVLSFGSDENSLTKLTDTLKQIPDIVDVEALAGYLQRMAGVPLIQAGNNNQNSNTNLKMEQKPEDKQEQTPVEPEKKEITLEDLAKQVADVVASVNAIRADVEGLKKDEEGTEEPSEELKALKSEQVKDKLEIKALTTKVTELKAVETAVTELKSSVDKVNKRLDDEAQIKGFEINMEKFFEKVGLKANPKGEEIPDLTKRL